MRQKEWLAIQGKLQEVSEEKSHIIKSMMYYFSILLILGVLFMSIILSIIFLNPDLFLLQAIHVHYKRENKKRKRNQKTLMIPCT